MAGPVTLGVAQGCYVSALRAENSKLRNAFAARRINGNRGRCKLETWNFELPFSPRRGEKGKKDDGLFSPPAFHGFRVGPPCGRAAPPTATFRRPVGAETAYATRTWNSGGGPRQATAPPHLPKASRFIRTAFVRGCSSPRTWRNMCKARS